MPTSTAIPAAQALLLQTLVTPTAQGIASRVLVTTTDGRVTLFAFDAGQGLTEHTSPFDALVLVLEGALSLTVGGVSVSATPGSVVRLPADVAHAVEAQVPTKTRSTRKRTSYTKNPPQGARSSVG